MKIWTDAGKPAVMTDAHAHLVSTLLVLALLLLLAVAIIEVP